MFPSSSPKKRKIEDSEQQKNDHSTWQNNNDYSGASVERDEKPSCSSKRHRLDALQNPTSNSTTSAPPHTLQCDDHRYERVREIISREYSREIKYKETQIELVDDRLEEAKNLLERLRYAIVAEYYKNQEQAQTMIDAAASMSVDNANKDGREKLTQIPLHPSLKKIIGKRPRSLEEIMRACPKREAARNAKHVLNTKSNAERREERRLQKIIREKGIVIDHTKQHIKAEPVEQKSTVNQTNQTKPKETTRTAQSVKTEHEVSRLEAPTPHVLNNMRTSNKLKCHFVVGNTSKYIGKSDEHAQPGGNTSYSHKWLVYVQTKDSEVSIQKYVKKVRFFLHPSYRPNDVVDIHDPPFQVARRGWGEFPMRIQLFFHESFQQKPLQLVHKVVLDTTKSGRHTLGAETVVEIWLRNDTPTPDLQHVKCENAIASNAEFSTTTTAMTATATTATATATATPVTPETHRKPRTISFNIKETFDDNFFDFLNKIEESRTSICADIEKIEPTLLVNETLEPRFSHTLRSPIKKELLRSPLKLPPSQHSPVKCTTARAIGEHQTLVVNPPILPKAIKEATTKLSAAIQQSEIEMNGLAHVKEITATKTVSQNTHVNANNRSSSLVDTTVPDTPTKITLNTSSLKVVPAPNIPKITTVNNTIALTSGKVFNNVSGTIILPVTKNQLTLQQPKEKQSPIIQVQPNTASNKAVFQKKTIQVMNAQGQVKTVQIIIAPPSTLPSAVAARPLTNTPTTSGIRIITSKSLNACTTNTPSVNVRSAITSSSTQPIVTTKLITATNSKAIVNSKPLTFVQAGRSFSPSALSQQHHSASANTGNSSLQPLATSFSKNMVFQKEGKLYFIDPLQMKLKQQRKNQVSLLKPQVKQQTQQKNTIVQSSVASDHDYAPPPPLCQNSVPLLTTQTTTSIRTPQVHLGMRETRLSAMKAQDIQKFQRIQLERKFNSIEFSSMRSAVEYLLRRLPLIANHKDSFATAFPFVRKTQREFHSLPAFKQRSYEWLRAKFIARILRNPKSLQALNAIGGETFWNTREIAAFARFYAYTPPIKALQQESGLSDEETVPGSKEHFAALIKTEMKSKELQLEYDSLSPGTQVTQWVNTMQACLKDVHHEFSSNEVIIIDDDDDDKYGAEKVASKDLSTSEAVAAKRIYGSPLKLQSKSNNLSYLPPPASLETAFQYVGDTCRDISVRLRPEEIVPGVLHSSAQTALAHVSQLFIERLLRQTIANKTLHQQGKHTSNTTHLPHNNQEHFVTAQDVRNTMSQSAEFDFLTNRHLGVATQHFKSE